MNFAPNLSNALLSVELGAIWMGITYLSGAIPFSWVVSRWKGIDLTQVGSGNMGATNVYRAMGLVYAVLVFLCDALKGAIPVYCATLLSGNAWFHMAIACVAIVGHSLSCFLNFKGGKGVATGVGVLAALSPVIALVIVLLAMGIIFMSRYVSVASIVCAVLAPVLFYVGGFPGAYVQVFMGIAAFILWRHRANIRRLMQGNENKV